MIKKYLIPNRVLSPATFSLLVLALGFFENFSQKKRLPKILGGLFRVKTVKNGELYHFVDF